MGDAQDILGCSHAENYDVFGDPLGETSKVEEIEIFPAFPRQPQNSEYTKLIEYRIKLLLREDLKIGKKLILFYS